MLKREEKEKDDCFYLNCGFWYPHNAQEESLFQIVFTERHWKERCNHPKCQTNEYCQQTIALRRKCLHYICIVLLHFVYTRIVYIPIISPLIFLKFTSEPIRTNKRGKNRTFHIESNSFSIRASVFAYFDSKSKRMFILLDNTYLNIERSSDEIGFERKTNNIVGRQTLRFLVFLIVESIDVLPDLLGQDCEYKYAYWAGSFGIQYNSLKTSIKIKHLCLFNTWIVEFLRSQ